LVSLGSIWTSSACEEVVGMMFWWFSLAPSVLRATCHGSYVLRSHSSVTRALHYTIRAVPGYVHAHCCVLRAAVLRATCRMRAACHIAAIAKFKVLPSAA
jgi:hypothetical protein